MASEKASAKTGMIMEESFCCAHVVLNSTSLQHIPAHSNQSSSFEQTLAGVDLSEPEYAGGIVETVS
jgi:hypothetical protein